MQDFRICGPAEGVAMEALLKTSGFGGGLAVIASNTELTISRALSGPTSSESEESKDAKRRYAREFSLGTQVSITLCAHGIDA